MTKNQKCPVGLTSTMEPPSGCDAMVWRRRTIPCAPMSAAPMWWSLTDAMLQRNRRACSSTSPRQSVASKQRLRIASVRAESIS